MSNKHASSGLISQELGESLTTFHSGFFSEFKLLYYIISFKLNVPFSVNAIQVRFSVFKREVEPVLAFSSGSRDLALA